MFKQIFLIVREFVYYPCVEMRDAIACEYSILLLSLSRKLNPNLNSQILREKYVLGQSLLGDQGNPHIHSHWHSSFLYLK